MSKKYEIELEGMDMDKKKARIRRWLKNNEFSSKVLVFLYKNQPSYVSKIKEKLENYYPSASISRTRVYRELKTLRNKELVVLIPASTVMRSRNIEDPIHKRVKRKHESFLSNIPEQFRKRYKDMCYFYVSEFGEELIPWAVKQLENIRIKGGSKE